MYVGVPIISPFRKYLRNLRFWYESVAQNFHHQTMKALFMFVVDIDKHIQTFAWKAHMNLKIVMSRQNARYYWLERHCYIVLVTKSIGKIMKILTVWLQILAIYIYVLWNEILGVSLGRSAADLKMGPKQKKREGRRVWTAKLRMHKYIRISLWLRFNGKWNNICTAVKNCLSCHSDVVIFLISLSLTMCCLTFMPQRAWPTPFSWSQPWKSSWPIVEMSHSVHARHFAHNANTYSTSNHNLNEIKILCWCHCRDC